LIFLLLYSFKIVNFFLEKNQQLFDENGTKRNLLIQTQILQFSSVFFQHNLFVGYLKQRNKAKVKNAQFDWSFNVLKVWPRVGYGFKIKDRTPSRSEKGSVMS
jgi:hypothetical protein